eukprot:420561-Alexandrium_andersonii.AAC.1
MRIGAPIRLHPQSALRKTQHRFCECPGAASTLRADPESAHESRPRGGPRSRDRNHSKLQSAIHQSAQAFA